MPQPMDVGTVLGGRYLITAHILTSAEQDQVLTGLDQVLNREVSILVASSAHATQVATSARQLATGERSSTVQVLDLGLSDDRTYLIASGDTDPEELLGLVVAHEVYVEPFETDTLGSEIFGESRTYEPEVYEDDEEYYSELDHTLAGEKESPARKSKFLNRLSDGLSARLGSQSAGTAAGAGIAGAGAGTAAGSAEPTDQTDVVPKTDADTDTETGADTDAVDTSAPQDGGEPTDPNPKVTLLPEDNQDLEDQVDGEESASTGPPSLQQRVAAAMASTGSQETVTDPEDAGTDTTGSAALAAAGATGAGAGGPGAGAGGSGGGEGFNSFFDGDGDDDYETEYVDERERSGAGKVVGGILLLAVLVIAVVVAFTMLGDNRGTDPAAQSPEPTTAAPTTDAETPGDNEEPEETQEPLAEPVIAGISRSVPDSPDLNSDSDGDLPQAIDGNPATAWHSLSFTQPQFGGFASSMAFIVELEENSAINELTITQNNGSGGSFSIIISDTPDPAEGTAVAEGSFTGPTYSVSVPQVEGEPMQGQYVILNVTELPTLSNAHSAERPYGLRLAEIEVD